MFQDINDTNWNFYTKGIGLTKSVITATKPAAKWSNLATICRFVKHLDPKLCTELIVYVYFIAKGARKINENTQIPVNDLQQDELYVYNRIQDEFTKNVNLKSHVISFLESKKFTRRDLSFFITKYCKAKQLRYYICNSTMPPQIVVEKTSESKEVVLHNAYKRAKKVFINSKNIMNPYTKTVQVADMKHALGITTFVIWLAKQGGTEIYSKHHDLMVAYRKSLQKSKNPSRKRKFSG